MRVVLLKDVDRLGKTGDVVEVRDGHGRNLLIPRGLAIDAHRMNMKSLENEKKKLESREKKSKEKAESMKEKLQNISCTIAMPTGEDDKLYGEVTPETIANFYRQEGLDIDKRKIHLDKSIRHLGVYQADIKLHPDIATNVKVWVVKK